MTTLFLSNQPFDALGQHTFDFANITIQQRYFCELCNPLIMENIQDILYYEQSIKVNIDYDAALNYNYLTVKTASDKYYYFYINSVSWNGANSVRLDISPDDIQTFLFVYELGDTFIERMHVDNIKSRGGQYVVNWDDLQELEPIDTGDAYQYFTKRLDTNRRDFDYYAIILSDEYPNTAPENTKTSMLVIPDVAGTANAGEVINSGTYIYVVAQGKQEAAQEFYLYRKKGNSDTRTSATLRGFIDSLYSSGYGEKILNIVKLQYGDYFEIINGKPSFTDDLSGENISVGVDIKNVVRGEYVTARAGAVVHILSMPLKPEEFTLDIDLINDLNKSDPNLTNYKSGVWQPTYEQKLNVAPYRQNTLLFCNDSVAEYRLNSLLETGYANKFWAVTLPDQTGKTVFWFRNGAVFAKNETSSKSINFPFASNAYNNYKYNERASTVSGLALKTAAAGAGFIGGLLTGNVLAAVGSGLSGVNAVNDFNQKEQQLKNKGDTVSQATSAIELLTEAAYGVMLSLRATLMPEQRDKFARYLCCYGVKVGKTIKITPQVLNSRRYFNYIKTANANVIGNIPQQAKENIATRFNNGLTFWHYSYGAKMYDYFSRNNYENIL